MIKISDIRKLGIPVEEGGYMQKRVPTDMDAWDEYDVPQLREICKVDGCEKEAGNRGWCPTHQRRWNWPEVHMISRLQARSRWHWQVRIKLYARLIVVYFAWGFAKAGFVDLGKRMADWAVDVPLL